MYEHAISYAQQSSGIDPATGLPSVIVTLTILDPDPEILSKLALPDPNLKDKVRKARLRRLDVTAPCACGHRLINHLNLRPEDTDGDIGALLAQDGRVAGCRSKVEGGPCPCTCFEERPGGVLTTPAGPPPQMPVVPHGVARTEAALAGRIAPPVVHEAKLQITEGTVAGGLKEVKPPPKPPPGPNMCVCGHPKVKHVADHGEFTCEGKNADLTGCDCNRFNPRR